MIHEFLPWPKRQFVQVTQDEGMRDVLIAEAFLAPEVVRILAIAPTRELRELWQSAIGIGERFGERVRG